MERITGRPNSGLMGRCRCTCVQVFIDPCLIELTPHPDLAAAVILGEDRASKLNKRSTETDTLDLTFDAPRWFDEVRVAGVQSA